jgi:hypothetical protein
MILPESTIKGVMMVRTMMVYNITLSFILIIKSCVQLAKKLKTRDIDLLLSGDD